MSDTAATTAPAPSTPKGIALTNRNGETREFAPEDVVSAYTSGQWTAPVDAPVPVVHNGTIGIVPFSQLLPATQGGASVISHEAYDKAQLQQQYGDIASQAENAATQALSGASLGTSDMLIGAIAGKDTREGIRKRAEANPIGSTVSKIAGALAPIVLSGGAAAPEEAAGIAAAEGGAEAAGLGARALGAAKGVATAPTNLLTKVGDAAEHAVSAILPEEAKGIAARLAVKAAQTGARGVAEGGAIGGLDYLGETALSDDQKLDGEKLWSSVGHGMLLGGLGGAGLGAASQLGSVALSRARGALTSQAEDSAASAILEGRTAKAAQKMDALPGGKAGVGRLLLDDGLVRAGESVTEIQPRIAAAREAAGAEIGNMRRALDDAGAEGPQLTELHDALDKGVLARLQEMPSLNSSAINKIESLKSDVAAMAGATEKAAAPTFNQAREFLRTPDGQAAMAQALRADGVKVAEQLGRGEIPKPILDAMGAGASPRLTFGQVAAIRGRLDDAINFTRDPFGKVDAVGDALIKARGALEDELTRAADDAAKKLGQEDWLEKYEAAKLKYRQLAVADEAATKAAQSRMKNRKFGLTDTIAGAGGMHLAGGPLGIISGLASAAAHRAIRERGSSTMAVMLDRLTAMDKIQRASAHVDNQIARGVAGALGRKTGAIEGPSAHGLETFGEKRAAVESAIQNMPAHTADLQQSVAAIAPHAPETASAFVDAAVRATVYLASVMPHTRPSNPSMPHVHPIEPSYHEQAVFSRVFDAVHDPLSTLNDMRDGTLTPEQVAAVQATAPKLKARIDDSLRQAMMRAVNAMPYPQAISTSLWLGAPTDPTLDPANVAALQANFLASPKGPPGTPPHGAPKAAKMKLAEQTSLESSVA